MRQFEHGAVAVQGDTIVAVGEESDLLAQSPSSQIVDCTGKVLIARPCR
jgi:predicted amidohydrolase YtcJ